MAKEVLEMEVKSNIGKVSKDMDKLADNTERAADEQSALNKSTGLGAIGFSRLTNVVVAFGTALKALGIGIAIAAFVALQEAMGRNQKVMNTVNTIMTTVSTTFNQVVGVLVDTYNWVTKSTDRFNGLGKVLRGVMTLSLLPLQLAFFGLKLGVQQLMLAWEKSPLGKGDEGKIAELRIGIGKTAIKLEDLGKSAIQAGKDIITNFGDAVNEVSSIATRVVDGVTDISIKSNYEMAQATTAAQNNAKLAEAALQGLIEKNDLLAETQRQIRDDETKTFAERIAANEELGRVLDQQEKDMLELAASRVAAAALELSANKENIDLQVAYQQTLNEEAAVKAQIAGFRSEQLTNEVSLNKELLEAENQLRAEGLSGIQRELEELEAAYKLKLDMARKAGADTTAIDAQYAKQRSDIVREGINTQLEAYSKLAGALGTLAGESKELAVAQAIIDTYVGANKAFAQGGTVGFVTAAAVIVAGLANVQKILSTPVPSGGGSGGGGSVAAPQTPAPQMMSGAFDLTGGQAPEPVRAYVVTDEMTNSQAQLANIRRRATI
jgi:hypothetical protein